MRLMNPLKTEQLKSLIRSNRATGDFHEPLYEVFFDSIPLFCDLWVEVTTWVIKRKIYKLTGNYNLIQD